MSFLSHVTEGNSRAIFRWIVLFKKLDWFWIEAGNPNIEAGIDLKNSLHRVALRIIISSTVLSNHGNLKRAHGREVIFSFFKFILASHDVINPSCIFWRHIILEKGPENAQI